MKEFKGISLSKKSMLERFGRLMLKFDLWLEHYQVGGKPIFKIRYHWT